MSQESDSNNNSMENIWSSSLDDIDEDISRKYPGVEKRKESIRAETSNKALSVDNKYKSVFTSGNKNDCLIHSFLTDVSLNFRKLSQAEKNEYADWFRREFFAQAFDDLEEDARNMVLGDDFLEEVHIKKLIDVYNINIVVFEKTGYGIGASLNLGGMENALEDEPFILIYNPGDLHFRAVRQTPENKYFFTFDEGVEIASVYAVGKEKSIPRVCPYEVGEEVIHEGQVKKIFQIVWGDAFNIMKCEGVRFVEKGPVIPIDQISKKPIIEPSLVEKAEEEQAIAQARKIAEQKAAANALVAEQQKKAAANALLAEQQKKALAEKAAANALLAEQQKKAAANALVAEQQKKALAEKAAANALLAEQQKKALAEKAAANALLAEQQKKAAANALLAEQKKAEEQQKTPTLPPKPEEKIPTTYPVGKTKEELLKQWAEVKDKGFRDAIVRKMKEERIFPEESETKLENTVGLYPDVRDPNFVKKLLDKREFAESKQRSIKDQVDEGVNPCDPEQEFEITPVQRFVSRFISPYTPYQSALLYHGVGVGKTCAAITIAEGYLEKYPRDQVYIIAPPNIQPGFERTIFDFEGLKIGKGIADSEVESEMNTAKGCTGNTYLKLSGTLFEQDKKTIESRVRALIRRRYKLMGYTQFANEIEQVEARIPRKAGSVDLINQEIRKEYSGKVIIIDEAHNLRDIPDEGEEENLDAPGGYGELSDAAAGKKLTPFLRRILTVAEGVSLILLTGTPMYNSYSEIIFLMNLLLLNEKRVSELLTKEKIFESNGNFKPGGRARLGEIAGRYVSFMRGENPLTFPVRLKPEETPDLHMLKTWPTKAPNGKPIEAEGTEMSVSEIQRANRFELPLVQCYFKGKNAEEYKEYTKKVASMGLGIQNANSLVQAGNWIFPGEEDESIDSRIRNEGFDNNFEARMEAKQIVFRSRTGKPEWLAESQIGVVSPKTEILIKRLRTCSGCAFIYSRFVKSGALSIALALEANGYTPWGRDKGFLADGVQAPGGLQCARCPRKKEEHTGLSIGHKFLPAKYILLTGSEEYSPNNPGAVSAERRVDNMYGEQVKVVIGSQVVSEGIDLRFIREIYVFDSWFHLNKLEQVVGRGIRTCSHALFPDKKLRNCTVYLLVNAFTPEPDGSTMETMDLYTYRRAIRKAVEVGRVTRVLKEYAVDCNLNHDAILVSGLSKVEMIDAQGNPRMADRNDIPFTALCDWEECDSYKCIPEVPVNPLTSNEKTYTEYAAKWQEQKLIERVRKLFQGRSGEAQQPFVSITEFKEYFEDISKKSLSILLQMILKSKSFYITLFGKKGRIIYKNGYFLFQPSELLDDTIPLALRIAPYPVKRDSYEPEKYTEVPLPPKPTILATTAIKPKLEKKEEAVLEKSEVVQDFWNTIEDWTNSIRKKDAVLSGIPTNVANALNIFHNRDEKLLRRSTERLGMISWLYVSVMNNDEWRNLLANIVEEIIWDEFLSPTDQMTLLSNWKTSSEIMNKYNHVYVENWLTSGSTSAFRFVDYRTGAMRLICDQKECTDLQKTVLEESESNKLKSVVVSSNNTGFLYGFLVPKKGELIFKNVAPPTPGNKVEKGQECSISSQVSDHLRKLRELGKAFESSKKGYDLDLNEEKLVGSRKFENAVRACFLMDLVLRFMDKQAISNKRWMYRTISSKIAGHKGTFEKGMEA